MPFQAVFGMNIVEIVPETNGTLAHYVETALPFTLLSIWIIIAFQSRYIFPSHVTFWKRLGWPVLLLSQYLGEGPVTDRSLIEVEEEELDNISPGAFNDATIREGVQSVDRLP